MRAARAIAAALLTWGLLACSEEDRAPAPVASGSSNSTAATPVSDADAPRLLYLPDGGDQAPVNSGQRPSALLGPQARAGACPAEMVDVAGNFCIDRWEAHLVDNGNGKKLSPYYAPSRRKTRREYKTWLTRRRSVGGPRAQAVPLPSPGFQRDQEVTPKAVSQAGKTPNGYLTATDAAQACENAGKRLCTEAEWVTACKGEQQQKFPYGKKYEYKTCNVFREKHPAGVLHDDPSRGHLDPRLNQVSYRGKPLLRKTGTTPSCQSRWGDDAIYDMVGNLDEWVDDPGGVFAGGFFSRSTKKGCDQRVSAHPREYYDYSLGVRCCKGP